jgi:diguanylate cyclase (GGDEF)-like protein
MPHTITEATEAPTQELIRGALIESRHRWQHLLGLAVDLAFETDRDGRFVFIMPESPLGWSRSDLIGQSSQLLVGEAGVEYNPFRPTQELQRQRTWLRCGDGGLAMLTLSVALLRDDQGTVVGARGVGIDMTAGDAQAARLAGRLRRAEVLPYMLSSIGHEAGADAKLDAALSVLMRALGAEGAAIVANAPDDAFATVLHECGHGAAAILPVAISLLSAAPQAVDVDGRLLLVVGLHASLATKAGVALWRGAAGHPWDAEDAALAESAVSVIRMLLDYQTAARQLIHHTSIDPLTGLLNRRAFLEEIPRHIARLDREGGEATLMVVDLDAFKSVNDRLGHPVGDDVLVRFAGMLRKLVRPGDLIARLGGDEFAIWLNGTDHMTAAERADFVCKTAPAELQAALPNPFPDLGVSIGIATRPAGSNEAIEDLTRRADTAMFEVKRGGRRHWRVSPHWAGR